MSINEQYYKKYSYYPEKVNIETMSWMSKLARKKNWL